MAHSASSSLPTSLRLPGHPFRAIGVGGVIVGILDLIYAILVYSPKRPIAIPQTIAGGLLGKQSYNGGIQTAILGVALHFLIAFVVAAVYYVASRRLDFLLQHAVVCGMIYGGLVYGFMHVVVVPLSAIEPHAMSLIYRVAEFVEHLFCVGLPVALSVRHYSH